MMGDRTICDKDARLGPVSWLGTKAVGKLPQLSRSVAISVTLLKCPLPVSCLYVRSLCEYEIVCGGRRTSYGSSFDCVSLGDRAQVVKLGVRGLCTPSHPTSSHST